MLRQPPDLEAPDDLERRGIDDRHRVAARVGHVDPLGNAAHRRRQPSWPVRRIPVPRIEQRRHAGHAPVLCRPPERGERRPGRAPWSPTASLAGAGQRHRRPHQREHGNQQRDAPPPALDPAPLYQSTARLIGSGLGLALLAGRDGSTTLRRCAGPTSRAALTERLGQADVPRSRSKVSWSSWVRRATRSVSAVFWRSSSACCLDIAACCSARSRS